MYDVCGVFRDTILFCEGWVSVCGCGSAHMCISISAYSPIFPISILQFCMTMHSRCDSNQPRFDGDDLGAVRPPFLRHFIPY